MKSLDALKALAIDLRAKARGSQTQIADELSAIITAIDTELATDATPKKKIVT